MPEPARAPASGRPPGTTDAAGEPRSGMPGNLLALLIATFPAAWAASRLVLRIREHAPDR